MPNRILATVTPFVALVALASFACARSATLGASSGTTMTPADGSPFVQAATPEVAGEYLTIVGGCGDCHTAMTGAGGPPDPGALLAGNPVGYRGPWGTSYAANLRMVVQHMPEDRWVTMLKTHNGRPPMPWDNVHKMNERDLRAIYSYIRSLGSAGSPTPHAVPPGQEPTTPYVDFTPKLPGHTS